MQFAECDVTITPGTKVEGRPTTMVQVVHPVPRQNFKFSKSPAILRRRAKNPPPVHFDAFTWPAQEGGKPVLEESYTYAKNLKINTNLTARDFDAKQQIRIS